MLFQKYIRFPALVLGLAVLAGLAGCATGGSGQGSQDEIPPETSEETEEDGETTIWNVSDDDEPRDQMGPYVEEPEWEQEPEREGDYIGPSVGEIKDDLFSSTWKEAMFWYSRSSLAGDAPPGMTTYSFILSRVPEDMYRQYIGFYYGRGDSRRGYEIQENIRWVNEAGFEVGGRAFLTSDSSGTGLFAMFGLRTGALSWSYTQAIEVTDDDGDTNFHSHDLAWVTTPYVGGGVSFFQSGEFKLGINASMGYRIVGERTISDPAGDLFKDVWEFKVNFEVIITPE